MKYFFLILFFCLTHTLFSQPVRIEATVKGMPAGRIYLSQIKGEELKNVDSMLVSGEIFRFNLKDPHPGVYRLTLGKTKKSSYFEEDPQFFDLIVNSEDLIQVNTYFNFPIEGMEVISSIENKLFYEYLKVSSIYKNQGAALLPLFGIYSSTDTFFNALNTEFARMQKDYNEKLTHLASDVPGSFASAYIKMNLIPQVDPSKGYDAMNSFLRAHFFDLTLFNDPRLIYSQAYTQKILEYLSFYRKPDLTQSEQEDLFIEAVDRIMERASYNEQVFEFILGYLIDGFDHFKMEKVLVHLALNHVEKGCETDSKKIMDQRLEAYKRMAIGNEVKDIVLLDMDGNTRRLSDLKNEYILVVFWSSWCPHCIKLLPEIKEWYVNEKNADLEVYAVSIDTSRFDWESNVLMHEYPWINVCNLQGWEGKATSDYNVYASPTMFLIDRNRKIIAKPTTFREFRRDVDKLAGRI
jgi:thiol-disulfide isomerase/thioredoxin